MILVSPPFTMAEKTGALSLGLSAAFFLSAPSLALYPLYFFISCCAVAPFFPATSFFLPVISHGKRNQSAIALSFDDGPSPESTPFLLALLNRYQIKATFFIIGKKGLQHPELIQEIMAHGHSIGNHSWSHDNLLMFRQPATLAKDIQKTQSLLADFGAIPLTFRPPVGITGPRLDPVLKRLGMFAVNFSARAYDRGNRNIRGLANKLLAATRAGDILLLHDTAPTDQYKLELWKKEMESLCRQLRTKFQIVPLERLIDKPVMAGKRRSAP
jgi:peptidoglycan/xylan/chitin deacetylase (PgdA/CDA1 family)